MDVLNYTSHTSFRRAARRGTGAITAVVLAALVLSRIAGAQSGEPTEYEVKAAFLFNFTKFVEWPASSFEDSHSPIVLGILGEDPFGDSLARIIAGQKVQGRSLIIRKKHFGDDLRLCHVLFVSSSEREHRAQILGSIPSASVLTVSDMEGFAAAGGVMQFVTQDSRVRFIVNLDAVAQNRLHFSAKLLALAQVIGHGNRWVN
jgi:hypothetical protein